MSRNFAIIYCFFRDMPRYFFNKSGDDRIIRVGRSINSGKLPISRAGLVKYQGNFDRIAGCKQSVFKDRGTLGKVLGSLKINPIRLFKFAFFQYPHHFSRKRIDR